MAQHNPQHNPQHDPQHNQVTEPVTAARLPFVLGTDLICALAPETDYGEVPATGWQPLARLSRFDLAPVVLHRPVRHLGPPTLPAASLSGLSSVQGRIGLHLQDSPACLTLLKLAFSNQMIKSAAPDTAPLPETDTTLVWHRLVPGQAAMSASVLAAHHRTGPADLFVGLRASSVQLQLDPATPPLVEVSLIGKQHLLSEQTGRPDLAMAVPSVLPPLPAAQLVLQINGQPVRFPVQFRLNLSSTPARPHYSLGRIWPDRITLGPAHITAAVSFLLAAPDALSWASGATPAALGLTLRLGSSVWLVLDAPSARILSSRHTHRGGSEPVLLQLDLELGPGAALLLARPETEQD